MTTSCRSWPRWRHPRERWSRRAARKVRPGRVAIRPRRRWVPGPRRASEVNDDLFIPSLDIRGAPLMGYYAAFLDVGGQRCLVVGGGEPALAKARGLLESGARVTIVWDRLIPEFRTTQGASVERRFGQADLGRCVMARDD